ncbi:unnamed protein product [Microthlaspi erraticum]|uniref:Uncharacterized protein n=1 Tax=Microthlaspi erraticum TaxID=1685480 RepID=A0A6D2HSR2_9BRAS|nr:unnamed protein product [Microthlaspi erraticum]
MQMMNTVVMRSSSQKNSTAEKDKHVEEADDDEGSDLEVLTEHEYRKATNDKYKLTRIEEDEEDIDPMVLRAIRRMQDSACKSAQQRRPKEEQGVCLAEPEATSEELLNLTNQELAHLERTNRKAKKPVEMVNHIVLIRGEDGLLFDPEGNRYNEQGQKLDAAGNVIVPEPCCT